MAAGEIHKFDSTLFLLVIKDENLAIVDISTASVLSVLFTDPDGNDTTKTGSLYTDGTDGVMKYQATGGASEASHSGADLDSTGRWQIQGYAVIGGKHYHSDIHDFTVTPNLN